jgi:photosystem II stability/assembly factor-like uncharacterized protein
MKTSWRWARAAALALAFGTPLYAQNREAPPINRSDDPFLSSFRFREIGPIGQGGRVDDIAVVNSDPRVYYVGFATTGLWKTTNNGTTFESVFDTYGTHSVGAVEVSQSNPNVVYVGTGEANNRQSSSFGEGMYKSTDAGRTFTHIGLRETQSIARIIVHPTNPDVVWVAAVGQLFGPNAERGVFKTTDGGRTWNKTLYVDENTGATELAIDPRNPNVLFAATYQRRRSACCFIGGGPGSGLWRSQDGGSTWSRMSGGGLPDGTMGRVALAIAPSNPDVMYAQIEVAQDRAQPIVAPPAPQPVSNQPGQQGQQPPAPNSRASGIWRSNDAGRTWEFRSNENQRPMYFSQIAVHSQNPDIVYVAGVNARRSNDGARTFTNMPGMGHVDHHAIWVNPRQGDHVMYGNDGSIDISYDQGATWEAPRLWSAAQSYHASVDMRRPYYVCTGLQDNGSWCGPSRVRSGTILPTDWYRVGGGDGFYSQVDPTNHHIVYAESQNGNISRRNLATGEGGSIRPSQNNVQGLQGPPQFRWNWSTPFMLSPHDPATVLLGGNRFFISRDRGQTWTASADLTKNLDRNQMKLMGFDYSLPSCNANAQTAGRQCLLSKGDGTSWAVTSTVGQSRVDARVMWAGTDDGNVQVSRDGGANWEEVGRNIPGGTKDYNISRVEPSHYDAGTAYVSIDGHRANDLRPYVYVTRDYGRTWTSIVNGLPQFGNVNSVRQDPKNRNLLYAATEFGFFVSLDEGRNWKKFLNGLAVVRIDDMLVHPRDNDLVLATHGRGIQIMDDITPLQQLTPEVMAADAHLFAPREAVLWKSDARLSRSVTGNKNWEAPPAPQGAAISYYFRTAPTGNVTLVVQRPDGSVFRDLPVQRAAGLQRSQWNLRGNPAPQPAGGGGGGGGGGQQGQGALATPGTYRIVLTVDGRTFTQNITVVDDTWMEVR